MENRSVLKDKVAHNMADGSTKDLTDNLDAPTEDHIRGLTYLDISKDLDELQNIAKKKGKDRTYDLVLDEASKGNGTPLAMFASLYSPDGFADNVKHTYNVPENNLKSHSENYKEKIQNQANPESVMLASRQPLFGVQKPFDYMETPGNEETQDMFAETYATPEGFIDKKTPAMKRAEKAIEDKYKNSFTNPHNYELLM